MANEPIDAVGEAGGIALNALDAARTNTPGEFTADPATQHSVANGNGVWTLSDFMALSILRSAEGSPNDAALGALTEDPKFIESQTYKSLQTFPENAPLNGKKATDVLGEDETFHMSFGDAVSMAARLFAANPGVFDALTEAGRQGMLMAGHASEASKAEKRAIGAVASLGLALPIRAPGDT